VGFLVEQGAKAVVVACNTATVVAAAELRRRFSVPIVALEPAIKPAVHVTQSKVVGVLATTRTIASPAVARLCADFGQGVDIRLQACPGWVAQVERGDLDTVATRQLVKTHVQPLLDAGADTLVLGCTHYPFLAPLIRELAGPGVTLVESSAAVARELARRTEGIRHPLHGSRQGVVRFFTTGDVAVAKTQMSRLWERQVEVEPVSVGSARLAAPAKVFAVAAPPVQPE
jgi:glutamate racemase